MCVCVCLCKNTLHKTHSHEYSHQYGCEPPLDTHTPVNSITNTINIDDDKCLEVMDCTTGIQHRQQRGRMCANAGGWQRVGLGKNEAGALKINLKRVGAKSHL